MPRYVHHPLNEEIRSIGGYYKVLQEGVLDYEGEKIFFVLKGAHADTACCGARGVGLVSVPGYVQRWKFDKNEDGLAVTEVRHITDTETRKRVKSLLKKQFSYIEVFEFD